jgi:predicted permease
VADLYDDIRYSLRALARSPAVASILIGSLAAGTGANATVFSLVNALLFRSAPGVADENSLVALYTSQFDGGPYGSSSYPDFESLAANWQTFSSLAAIDDNTLVTWQSGDALERVRVAAVSSTYFATLGMRPALGQLALANAAADTPDAVISHRLWQQGFGGDANAVGQTITIDDRPYRLAGVAPDRFNGLQLGRVVEIWVPLNTGELGERGERRLSVIGRLAPGVSLDAAQQRTQAVAADLAGRFPESNRGSIAGREDPRRITVAHLARLDPVLRVRVALVSAVMLGATALVLLSACANAGSLLLSRATSRGREIAVRFALGATPRRLLKLLLTESLLVSTLGGAAGLLLAAWTAQAIPSLFPPEQAQMLDTHLDAFAFAATLLISVAAGVGFGLTPAWQATRPAMVLALRGDGSGASEALGGARLRTILVTAQVALSVILMVATAVVVRSLTDALRADPGFARNVAIAAIELPGRYGLPIRGGQLLHGSVERVLRLPAVEAAAWVSVPPLGRASTRRFLIYPGGTATPEGADIAINVVSPAYFEAMQIPRVAGRSFDDNDRPRSQPVVIVNDELARRYFRGAPLGEWMRDDDNLVKIVGVVKSARYRTLQEPPLPMVYFPLAQNYQADLSLVVRTSADPAALLEPIRSALIATDSGVKIFRTVTLDTFLAESLALDRLTTGLVGTCGVLALILAVIGVYAVMADVVARRTREIGVRVALGARPVQVVTLVYGQGLGLTATGLAIGLVGACAGIKLMESTTEATAAVDVTTIAAIPGLLALMIVIAAVVPTLRALRVDPTIALRE